MLRCADEQTVEEQIFSTSAAAIYKDVLRCTENRKNLKESLVSAEFSQRLDSRHKTPLVPAVTCYLSVLAVWGK